MSGEFLFFFFKWEGGKSKLMPKIEQVYNKDFIWNSNRYIYIELFSGGGSYYKNINLND